MRVLIDGTEQSPTAVWLRGDNLDDRTSRMLRSLPGAERYLVVSGGNLTGWDETVPRAKLPAGNWMPLSEWLSVHFPVAAFATAVTQRVPLRLVRSDSPIDANLLKLDWPMWRDYAITAPQIRLNQWTFAVSDRHEVLVRGLPLVPLPGQLYVEQSGIAIPAGWRLEPQVELAALHEAWNLDANEVVLLSLEGTMQRIPETAFVRATRSAVRLTDGSLG